MHSKYSVNTSQQNRVRNKQAEWKYINWHLNGNLLKLYDWRRQCPNWKCLGDLSWQKGKVSTKTRYLKKRRMLTGLQGARVHATVTSACKKNMNIVSLLTVRLESPSLKTKALLAQVMLWTFHWPGCRLTFWQRNWSDACERFIIHLFSKATTIPRYWLETDLLLLNFQKC